MSNLDPAKIAELEARGKITPEVAGRAKESFARRLGSSISGGIGDAIGAMKTVGGAIAEPVVEFGQGLMGVESEEEEAAPSQAPLAGGNSIQPVSVPAVADASAPSQLKLASDVQAAPQNPDMVGGSPGLGSAGLNAMGGAMGKQRTAINMAANAESSKAEQIATEIDNQVKADEIVRSKQLVRQGAEDKQLDDMLTDRNAAIAEFKGMEVDPGRLWRNRSTGDKILAGVSLFLGSFGGARGNTAVTVLNDAIDQDIAAQKANIATAGDAIKAQTGLYQEMRQRFGDERMADAATRSAYIEQMKLKVESISQRSAGPLIKANALKAIGMLEQQQANSMMEFEKAAQVVAAQRRLQGGQVSQTDMDIASLPPEQQKEYRATRVRGKGVDGFAGSQEQQKLLQGVVNDTEAATASIDDLMTLGDRHGKAISGTEARAEADVLKIMLTASLRTQVVGPGAVSKEEWELLESAVRNPLALTTLNAKTALKKLKVVLNRNMLTKLKNSGIGMKQVSYGEAK